MPAGGRKKGTEVLVLKGTRSRDLPITQKVVLEYHGSKEKKYVIQILRNHGFTLVLDTGG